MVFAQSSRASAAASEKPRQGSPKLVADAGSISILSVRGLVAELNRRGFEARPLLRSVQLDEIELANTCLKIRAAAVDRLIAQALELTQCPSLGLSVGATAPEFQLMSHLAQALPTLRDATSMLQRYCPIFFDDMRITLREENGTAYFSYTLGSQLSTLSRRFFSEVMSGQCVRIAQRFFTDGLAPVEVAFSHPRPEYIEPYQKIFGCPLRFSSDECVIAFDATKLDCEQPHANAFMGELLRDACERLLITATHEATFAERVRMEISKHPDLCKIDAASLGRTLDMTPRALRTRLAREGVTLTTLMEEARIAAAAAELKNPSVSIKETGAKLGYSDVSAFHRAFKRWMNKTPGEYVRELRSATTRY